jgi:hypothetical protein
MATTYKLTNISADRSNRGGVLEEPVIAGRGLRLRTSRIISSAQYNRGPTKHQIAVLVNRKVITKETLISGVAHLETTPEVHPETPALEVAKVSLPEEAPSLPETQEEVPLDGSEKAPAKRRKKI